MSKTSSGNLYKILFKFVISQFSNSKKSIFKSMRKLFSVIFLLLIGCFFSSCPGNRSTTWVTIETARVLLFSFDVNGIYPYLGKFDRNELGIGVFPDSTSERVELAQSRAFGNKLYAMENPNSRVETNSIDSLNFITLYDFDANHPALSNVNDVLKFLDYMGKTGTVNVNGLSAFEHFFKFSAVPQNDSLQFEVTGRITDVGKFKALTDLVIMN